MVGDYMDTLLANIASFITPVCALIAFIWVVAVKKPHDEEEKHNREIIKSQLQSFTEAMNRLEKRAFETIKELKDAIHQLTQELQTIVKSKENFEARLNKCEKDVEKHSTKIEDLAKIMMQK